jgi:hypothetical protein
MIIIERKTKRVCHSKYVISCYAGIYLPFTKGSLVQDGRFFDRLGWPFCIIKYCTSICLGFVVDDGMHGLVGKQARFHLRGDGGTRCYGSVRCVHVWKLIDIKQNSEIRGGRQYVRRSVSFFVIMRIQRVTTLSTPHVIIMIKE